MMLAATGTREILRSKSYIFEPKLDGYRALCQKRGGTLRFISRNNRDITLEFPELSFGDLIKSDCTLDGEIVIYDEKGNPSFALMQQRKHLRPPPTYVAFDMLELDGRDLRKLPLSERKKLLSEVIEEGGNLQTMPSTENGEELWNVVTARGLEGDGEEKGKRLCRWTIAGLAQDQARKNGRWCYRRVCNEDEGDRFVGTWVV